MKIKYIGTAAAEAIPAIFCQCDVCKTSKKNGNKDIRGRSGIVIDDNLLIDFPPDIHMNSLKFNINLSKITDILITHTHLDHFDVAELMMRMPECYCYITDGEQYINLYGNKKVRQMLELFSELEFGNNKYTEFIKYTELNKFEKKMISTYNVIPLSANHTPNGDDFIYIIEKNNRKILYAHDTGFFKKETFEFLHKTKIEFDFISFDCTCGITRCDYNSHMGIPNILEVKDILQNQGNLKSNTKIVVSHFSHNCGSTHEEIIKEASKYNFITAYDGMEINI